MSWLGFVLDGKSDVMQKLRQQLQQASRRRASVLLVGEPGCGLRWIAHAMYMESPFAPIPFHLVDCRLPLTEFRLLGRPSAVGQGLLEQNSPVALLLEEVGSLTERLRKKVNDQILGSESKKRPWILGTTSETYPGEVEEICMQMFAGLSIRVIQVPPLRERGPDILDLLFKLLTFLCSPDNPPGITTTAQQFLCKQEWPFNIQEMVDFLRKLLQDRPKNEPITLEEVRSYLAPQGPSDSDVSLDTIPLEQLLFRRLQNYLGQLGTEFSSTKELYRQLLPYFERPLIQLVLEKTRGNQLQASYILGLNRNTLRKKCQTLEIEPNDFRNKNDP